MYEDPSSCLINFQSSRSRCLYGSPCLSSVFDYRSSFFSFPRNFSRVFRKGSLFCFFLLPFSSSSLISESKSSRSPPLLLFPASKFPNPPFPMLLIGLFSMASCRRVCLNFSFVALNTSIFLSYFIVSSFVPVGFSSNMISLFVPYCC